MLIVRIDKHPSDGSQPEHIETVTIANVSTQAELSGSVHLYGVWRNSRSVQEAPDYTVTRIKGDGVSVLVSNALMYKHAGR